MEWANSKRETGLKDLQNCTNQAVDWFELVVSAPRSEKFPLQGVQFPRWGSSGLEDGLNNLSWETLLWAMSCVHSGVTPTTSIAPGRGDRPPLVWGDHFWQESPMESRRGDKSGRKTILGPARSRLTSFQRTLAGAPGIRAIRGKAYRRSLGHICTIASSPSGVGWTREYQMGHCAVSWVAKRSTWAWPNTLQICFTASGWSIHSPGLCPCLDRMSAPILRCPGIYSTLNERSFPWAHTRIWRASVYKGCERRPPWWLI